MKLKIGILIIIWDLMWKFVEKYDMSIVKAKYPDAILTPADINYDTKGWNIHPS